MIKAHLTIREEIEDMFGSYSGHWLNEERKFTPLIMEAEISKSGKVKKNYSRLYQNDSQFTGHEMRIVPVKKRSLTDGQIEGILLLLKQGVSGSKLSEMFSVSESTIGLIKNGLLYTDKRQYENDIKFVLGLDTQQKCMDYLEYCRWNMSPTCPFCGSKQHYNNTPISQYQSYSCKDCRQRYSIIVGTYLQNTKMFLPKWFLLRGMLMEEPKISTPRIAHELCITQRSAWKAKGKLINSTKHDKIFNDELIKKWCSVGF